MCLFYTRFNCHPYYYVHVLIMRKHIEYSHTTQLVDIPENYHITNNTTEAYNEGKIVI